LCLAHAKQETRLTGSTKVRARLALLRAKKPCTKAGQVRALWPDIEAALAGGQSMKNICDGWKEKPG
jgi:hypothetical protein